MLGERLSSARVSALAAGARQQPRPWIQFDPEQIERSYNRLPFLVKHRLAERPQFMLPSLFALCRRMPTPAVKVRIGKVPGDADFDSSLHRYNHGLTLEDAVEHFEEREAYIVVYNPERDAEYRPVIEGLLGEIIVGIERLDPRPTWYSTYFFISARHAVTPYHMDREMNFLLQIRGHKTVRLWDPADETIMTQAQKDRLLSAEGEARPAYLPSFASKAKVFELEPGLGVHHPFIAPHLVTTGSELSISLAITFRTARSDVWADAHRFNHRMRRLGLHPRAVESNPAVDATKAACLRGLRGMRNAVRGGTEAEGA